MKTFRDPVHNLIQLDKVEERLLLDLIDTPEFQRLHHIKQLGFSFLIYPGAEHTRFSHSLGVLHLMKRFLDHIIQKTRGEGRRYAEELEKDRLLALAAALLHDIGHGPFSHTLEKTTGIRHEHWTIAIILGETHIRQILESHRTGFAQEVADVIRRTHSSRAVVKLLSSQLDVDRMDYLLRDAMMTGAGYGRFDLEWLLHTIRIGEMDGEVQVGLDREKGLSIAEDFIMARYYMFTHVYLHKTTRSAELMIDKIFERVVELKKEGKIDLPESLDRLFSSRLGTDQLKGLLPAYLSLTDYTLWYLISEWKKAEDPVLSDLSRRILERDLYKLVDLPDDPPALFEQVKRIARNLQISPDMVKYLFLRDEASSIPYKDPYLSRSFVASEKESEKEASERVILFDRRGKGAELSEVSDLVRLIRSKRLSFHRIYVPKEIKYKLISGKEGEF